MIARALLGYRVKRIDDHAREGGFQLVSDGQKFALVRFDGAAWVFSSGVPLDFTPTHYHTRQHREVAA